MQTNHCMDIAVLRTGQIRLHQQILISTTDRDEQQILQLQIIAFSVVRLCNNTLYIISKITAIIRRICDFVNIRSISSPKLIDFPIKRLKVNVDIDDRSIDRSRQHDDGVDGIRYVRIDERRLNNFAAHRMGDDDDAFGRIRQTTVQLEHGLNGFGNKVRLIVEESTKDSKEFVVEVHYWNLL